MDLMQQQKEAAAMEKLRQLMPQLGDMVRALALSKAEWDIDQAVAMLRSFQVSHLDKVNALNKVGGGGGPAAVACTVGEAATAVAASSMPLWADTALRPAVAGHTCNMVSATLLLLSRVTVHIPTSPCCPPCSAARSFEKPWRPAQGQRSQRLAAAAPAAAVTVTRTVAPAAAVTARASGGPQR